METTNYGGHLEVVGRKLNYNSIYTDLQKTFDAYHSIYRNNFWEVKATKEYFFTNVNDSVLKNGKEFVIMVKKQLLHGAVILVNSNSCNTI